MTQTQLTPLTKDKQELERINNWIRTALIDIKCVHPKDLRVGDILRASMTMDLNIQAVRFWRIIGIEKVDSDYRKQKDYVFTVETVIEPDNGGFAFKQKYTVRSSRSHPTGKYYVLREVNSPHKTWDEWHRAEYGGASRSHPKSNIMNRFSLVEGQI